MKDARFTIEFLTPCLASGGMPEDGIPDTFQRDSKDRIVMPASGWHAAFTRAITLARLNDNVRATDIQMDPSVTAVTERFQRRFDQDSVRDHEAIMPGTKITLDAMVEDHITQDILEALLTRMGKYVGFSLYGHKLGMGKFSLISLTVQED